MAIQNLFLPTGIQTIAFYIEDLLIGREVSPLQLNGIEIHCGKCSSSLTSLLGIARGRWLKGIRRLSLKEQISLLTKT